MAVTEDDVRKAARLSRIKVHEDQLAPLAEELGTIVHWVEQLNDVNVEGVAPMAGIVAVSTPMREDAVTDGDNAGDILTNAPQTAHGYFVVPKSVE